MKNVLVSRGTGAALIILLTVVAYLPALRAGFIWDDDDHLTQNPAMTSVGGLKQIWSSLSVSRYYPLTLTSFWVQRRIWGLHPLPYHAVNITLQAANAVLLWTLLRQLGVRGAWVAAALWAAHPVNVETVAWVTELKNTQSGLFFLVALLLFLRFEDSLRPRDYVAALVCGAAAMLSKPSTVILPGMMLVCVWWRRGRWTRQDVWRVAPLVVVAAGMSLLTVVEQRRDIARGVPSDWTLTAMQRLALAGRAVWFYVGKLFWPHDLTFVYPRWELPVKAVTTWLPLVGLALVSAVLWHFRRAGWARAAIFGLGCFILALLPVLGFVDIYYFRYSFVADHFQYLAGSGLIALAVGAGARIFPQAGGWGRDLGAVAAAAGVLTLGVCTWRQAGVYQDAATIWRDTLAKNPAAWMAHSNLGGLWLQQGRLPEALREFEQAAQVRPNYAEAHYVMGTILERMGRSEDAVRQYEQAVRIKPDYAEAQYNLGVGLERAHRFEDAIGHFERALQVRPDYAEAHNNLAVALDQVGRSEAAIRHWKQALRIKPDYADAHYNLGVTLERTGHIQEAIGQYEQTVRIKPDFGEAQNRLTQLRGRH